MAKFLKLTITGAERTISATVGLAVTSDGWQATLLDDEASYETAMYGTERGALMAAIEVLLARLSAVSTGNACYGSTAAMVGISRAE